MISLKCTLKLVAIKYSKIVYFMNPNLGKFDCLINLLFLFQEKTAKQIFVDRK